MTTPEWDAIDWAWIAPWLIANWAWLVEFLIGCVWGVAVILLVQAIWRKLRRRPWPNRT